MGESQKMSFVSTKITTAKTISTNPFATNIFPNICNANVKRTWYGRNKDTLM